MMTVTEALALATARLTDDEDAQLARLEEMVDSTFHQKFDGGRGQIDIDANEVPAKVAHALVRRYRQPAPDGSRWDVKWVRRRRGLGLDHLQAGVIAVAGASNG